jgi:hypothetical protein
MIFRSLFLYMHPLYILFLVPFVSATWQLSSIVNSTNFLDNFSFVTYDDPTHGFVNYVDQDTAVKNGYFSVSPNPPHVLLKSDFANVVPTGSRGRDSIRVQSVQEFSTKGTLMVFDIFHMPVGCGTWPALWFVGDNWPNNGEIDVIEGVNLQNFNQMSLHTGGNCTIPPVNLVQMGTTVITDCKVSTSVGCSVNTRRTFTYGARFNVRRGGLYAISMTSDGIRMWFIQRTQFDYIHPPNVEKWGSPQAFFPFSPNCPSGNFGNQSLVINLTFCGDWAGTSFNEQCTGDCKTFVANNPKAFQEAYWEFGNFYIFTQ